MLDNGVPITGMVEEVDPSRLKLAGEYGARFEVKTFRIKDAQVFHGTIDPDKDYASMTGFFTGMVLAGGLGWFLRDNGDIGCCDAPLAVAVRWGAIGAGIGGIMGAVSTQEREIWRPIPKLAVTIPIE
jgi:hypothetical protein